MRFGSAVKQGCLATLALVVLAVLVLGILVGLAALKGGPVVESEAVEQQAPVWSASREPGRILLDTNLADVTVEAAEAGGPVRVEAEYDGTTYALVTESEAYGEIGWIRYFVQRALYDGERPKLRVYLPPGVPLAVEGSVNRGSTNMRLGGLWLTTVDVRLRRGGQQIHFDEPLPAPLERFAVENTMGSLRITSLGNASPKDSSIESFFGGVDLDLEGRWTVDASIATNCNMGECFVHMPKEVPVYGLEEHGVEPRAPVDDDVPKLNVTVRSDDHVRIDH